MSGSTASKEASAGKLMPDQAGMFNVERLLRVFSSLRLTVWGLLLLLLFVGSLLLIESMPVFWLALPLGLLSLNLLAAILTHPSFRREPALLAFHLALLALVGLAALGRLTYFTGQAEVTTGEGFDATLLQRQAGPWHNDRLARLQFRLDDFSIDYAPLDGKPQRGATRAMVRWLDSQGNARQGVVGDHRPLVLEGYRFYTTHNKGFAPSFLWQPRGGAPQQGSIHFPAWPTYAYGQMQTWSVPGIATELRAELRFDEVILDPQRPSRFRAPREHRLVVRVGKVQHELQPGQGIDFQNGRLTYQELRTWMGFKVFYDWSLPWLFAAGVAAVLSLAWHFWRRFAINPWLDMEESDPGMERKEA